MRKNKEVSEYTLLSKIYGSNQSFQGPICRFVRYGEVGREKKPRGRRKKRKKARAGSLDVGLKHHLGAIDLGTVLGANNHDAKLGANNPGAKLGVKVPAKSPPRLPLLGMCSSMTLSFRHWRHQNRHIYYFMTKLWRNRFRHWMSVIFWITWQNVYFRHRCAFLLWRNGPRHRRVFFLWRCIFVIDVAPFSS